MSLGCLESTLTKTLICLPWTKTEVSEFGDLGLRGQIELIFNLSHEAVLHRGVIRYLGVDMVPYVCVILLDNFGEMKTLHVYNIA